MTGSGRSCVSGFRRSDPEQKRRPWFLISRGPWHLLVNQPWDDHRQRERRPWFFSSAGRGSIIRAARWGICRTVNFREEFSLLCRDYPTYRPHLVPCARPGSGCKGAVHAARHGQRRCIAEVG
jgi:hypothetical protein